MLVVIQNISKLFENYFHKKIEFVFKLTSNMRLFEFCEFMSIVIEVNTGYFNKIFGQKAMC